MLTPHQQAALNIDKHISLTANAGSGKTFVLSKRYLEIALKKDVTLRNIAAITFTDKAASELYKKIANEIEENIENSTNQGLTRKLEFLRRQLISANISTIHSFCINVLRQFPVEAGIDANFTPIDEQTSNELVELSIEDIINHHLTSGDEELKNLIRLFGSKAAFSRQMFSLIKNRKNVLICAENIYTADIQDIAHFFDSTFNQLVNTLLSDFQIRLLESIKRINENVLLTKPENKHGLQIASLLNQYKQVTKPSEQIGILKQVMQLICTTSGTIRKQGYFKDGYDRFTNEISFVEKYFSFFKKLEITDDAERINRALAEFGKELLKFFYKILSVYEKKKTENGFLDFEDILLLTQNIIASDDVRGYLTSQYKYIMIDEYQDTNELQYNIFLPILDGLKKNNLFVVGDEKQSIYMFRDAELEVFDRTKNDIKNASGGEQLISLPDSFRMSPAICLFTNTLFKKLFENPNPQFNEVAHSDLVCARTDDTFGGVELLILKKEKDVTLENELPEAELVAKKILQIKKQTEIKWSDIAILCRKRSPFADLEKIFVKYKIPFTIIGGKGFFQRQTIYDIYNYFSFLLDPDNDTALVGILRSPFFTISDAEIFKLSLIDKKSYFEKLKAKSVSDAKLKKICAFLSENILLSKNSDIPAVLRKILTETGYTAVVASRANGIQETANVEKLIKLTIQFNASGYKTLYDYVNFLKEAIESLDDEAQAALSDESNSVNIMTVHQSKGMEYSYVFLYKCAEGAQQSMVKAKQISVDKNFGLLTKLPLDNNYFADYLPAPILSVTDYISKRKHLAELKRLFYVAVTRAKDYLIISAEIKDTIGESTFIGLLKEGLSIDFDAESHRLSGELNYLLNEDGFKNAAKTISLEIPIIKELIVVPTDDFAITDVKEIKKYYLNKIEDLPSEEFISATKVAVYTQCPVKYQLTYDFGFTNIFSNYKKWKQANKNISVKYEFNAAEDISPNETDNDQKSFADVKGRIVHKALQKSIGLPALDIFVETALHQELDSLTFDKNKAFTLKEDIVKDLQNFLSSKTYKKLSEVRVSFNEYEVYLKENDYYLYGIIDKLIIDDKKIIITDYKTDDISLIQIPERAANYLTQLKFYSYIVCRLFDNFEELILKLVFIKHPDEIVEQTILPEQTKTIGEEIKSMSEVVRAGKYIKNKNHCGNCLFTLNKKDCIKEV